MFRNLFIVFGVAIACLVTAQIAHAEHPAKKVFSEKIDVPGPVEPSKAVDSIVVAPGFRLELVAAEPLIHDPMAMEFDENGDAYVLEIPAYNEGNKKGPRTPGSIARLEDTDGDGRFDKRVTFADKLKYPTGLFCYQGGLFVGDAPDLLYLKDTDGDGRADVREKLYTGFGAAPAGESQINSFRWGLDNRIHLNTGLDGGDIRPADKPDAQPRNVRNRNILFEPRTRTFVLASGGGQHGMSFDDWGRTYVCENSHPIQTILYDDRYVERNPLMSAPAPVANIGPGKGYTKLARVSEPDAWRIIRNRLRESGQKLNEPFEEGRASGVITSATGVTVYRGDAWPDEYRGHVFVGEVANNVVYHARIKPNGLSVASECVNPKAEFIAAHDTWFRPAQFAHGPDGNLYVIDMYRQLIEGVQWVPEEVLARMNPTAGNDRGRIYRIARDGFKRSPPVRLGRMSTAELVQQLAHHNGWRRDTAARLIYERQDRAAIVPLRKLLAESTFPQARMHALYALQGLGALEANDVLRGLVDEHPRVREHAIRVSETFAGESEPVQQKLAQMTSDADLSVRFQLAFSAGFMPVEQRNPVLIALLRSDGANSWFRVAVQSSLHRGAAAFLHQVLADKSLRESEHGQEFLASLANQVGRAKDDDEIQLAVNALDKLADDNELTAKLAKSITISMLADGSGASADDLAAHSKGCVAKILGELLTSARITALDVSRSDDSRLEAITILGCGRFASERPAFDELLSPQQPQPIQEAIVKILGRFPDADVSELLLSKWPSLTPGMRAATAEVLMARPEWTEALLSAVEKKEVSAGDFDPARMALLQSHPSQKIREHAAAVFSGQTVARRANVVADYKNVFDLAGDTERGRAVFKKSCSTCHELEGVGSAIGADLRSVKDRGAEAIMLNILDPNREINPKFLTYLIITADGRTISGVITEETPNNLNVRLADGTSVALPRTDIEEMNSTGLSYMPEGLESQIDHQAMADLLAYLNAIDSTKNNANSGNY